MTLKEELEILRGEPIQVFEGDPMDIPCIETSDPERLCKHPVVSVNMITYNHEPYIRQAIEGVMMQKTDFEFELVIGEDCSTDKTREICFEYQKRYPDKIRVLWCNYNLYRNPHPAGDNGTRNMAHCRGEFIAFCEGDDYWTDSLKLQKQVDVMRVNPEIGFCFCRAKLLQNKTGEISDWPLVYKPGKMTGLEFQKKLCSSSHWPDKTIATASTLIRKSVFDEARRKYDILSWRLTFSDMTTWLSCASEGAVCYIQDIVSVYRITETGACGTNLKRINRDGHLVKLYFQWVKDIKGREYKLNFSSLIFSSVLGYLSVDRDRLISVCNGRLFAKLPLTLRCVLDLYVNCIKAHICSTYLVMFFNGVLARMNF